MKVLVIAGDRWHPMEVVKKGILEFQDMAPDVTYDFIEDAKDMLTPGMLRMYDCVIVGKANVMTHANDSLWMVPGTAEVCEEELRDYILEGGGVMFFHAGGGETKAKSPKWCELTGNSFLGHPDRCEVRVEISGEHEITEGCQGFSERDEHYQLEYLADDLDVFLRSYSDFAKEQAAGYTRTLGKGRICVLIPGHTLAVFRNPEFRKIFLNSVKWCAARK